MSIFFEKSLRFEDFGFRPEFWVVVDHVERKSDNSAFLDLESSKFSGRVYPVLDAQPIISGHWRVQTQVFLTIINKNDNQ